MFTNEEIYTKYLTQRKFRYCFIEIEEIDIGLKIIDHRMFRHGFLKISGLEITVNENYLEIINNTNCEIVLNNAIIPSKQSYCLYDFKEDPIICYMGKKTFVLIFSKHYDYLQGFIHNKNLENLRQKLKYGPLEINVLLSLVIGITLILSGLSVILTLVYFGISLIIFFGLLKHIERRDWSLLTQNIYNYSNLDAVHLLTEVIELID